MCLYWTCTGGLDQAAPYGILVLDKIHARRDAFRTWFLELHVESSRKQMFVKDCIQAEF